MPREFPYPECDDGRRNWLASLLLRKPDRFMPRLSAALSRWRALSRNSRRQFQRRFGFRRTGVRLAGAALILVMAGSPMLVPAVHAAGITVDGATCSLVDAIRAANTDAPVNGCAAGNGADTITLQGDVMLTSAAGNYYDSDTGLPLVTSEITIEGSGHVIERDTADTDQFRLLAVSSTGDLTINDVTLSGGDSAENGGGFYVYYGQLSLNNSTVSGNYAHKYGGGGFNQTGVVTITDAVFRYNESGYGGSAFSTTYKSSFAISDATIVGSLFENNTTPGGGTISLAGYYGALDVINTTISDNYAGRAGGIDAGYEGSVDVIGSTITNNVATGSGGGVFIWKGAVRIYNSTISGNRAMGEFDGGGGVFIAWGGLLIENSTVTGNYALHGGGGIHQWYYESESTISRSIISGNDSGDSSHPNELWNEHGDSMEVDDYNVLGHAGETSSEAFYGFSLGTKDVIATSDAANIPLANILDPTAADNGGPTLTHNLVAGSPAVDIAPNADCAAGKINGLDQRGAARPFDVPGQGNDGGDNLCDAGAVEFNSPVPTAVFMSVNRKGTTDDGVAFNPNDILKRDGSGWSKWFDGTSAGLLPSGRASHDIDALWIEDEAAGSFVAGFTKNGRSVPGITRNVNNTDLVRWNGSSFSFYFDGADVGLTRSQEGIDGLHILPGGTTALPGDSASCARYLLISLQGNGTVTGPTGQSLKVRGEDVLGFCATSLGENTAGTWNLVLNGHAEGMPRNSTDSISFSHDGRTMYLTTRGKFKVDAASGSHSMVYKYDVPTGTFSGPYFDAKAEGLPQRVDALQVDGVLP